MGHLIGFVITLCMLTIVLVFMGWTTRKRKRPNWKKYGPLMLCLMAFPLIMLEPIRHLLVDHKIWETATMYRNNNNNKEKTLPLNPHLR